MARKEQEGMAAGDLDINIEEGEHDHQFAQVGDSGPHVLRFVGKLDYLKGCMR